MKLWLILIGLIAAFEVVFAAGILLDRTAESGPLYGDVLLSLAVAAAAAALFGGLWLRRTRPQLASRLMVLGLVPAALSGAVFFWFPPFWGLSVIAVWLIVIAAREMDNVHASVPVPGA